VLTALIAAAIPAGPVSGQQEFPGTRPPATNHDFRAWFDAVNRHVPGQRDNAVTQIAPWSKPELDSVFGQFSRQVPADRLRTLARALVLHTDIAILHRTTNGYDLPAGPNSATLFKDGRAVGLMLGTVHWDFARRLLNRAPEGEERLRIGRQFYRAAAAVLQRWGEYPELTAHLTAARRFLGDDAVLVMYEGTMRQAYAGPKVQRFLDERRQSPRLIGPGASPDSFRPPAPGNAPSQLLPSVNDSRTQAERLFRLALSLQPAFPEASIRLAHILGDHGRHDEAFAELARALSAQLPHFLEYYASLLQGREARALGKNDVAKTAFERAGALYPDAPSPKFGLSELALSTGDRTQGLARIIEERAQRLEKNEPWWWIDREHDPSAESLIAEMRHSVPP
jgi:tetratricopeptide (TPR) repeat protein